MRTGSMRVAEISLPAVRHNVARFREISGGAAVIAVLKANGYGHGAAICARAVLDGGATLLAVADLEEAMSLREEGIDAPILCWLHGARADFDPGVRAGIEIAVNDLRQLEALAESAARVGVTATTQLKLDTGLSRNGAGAEDWPAFFGRAAELERSGLLRVRGVFSHLANAGDAQDRAQAARFDEAIALLESYGVKPKLRHLAATAATLSSPHLHYNAVRVGMGIFGLSPFAGRPSAEFGLQPVMTLKSEIVARRPVKAGTGVSYGYNYVCEKDTVLGLVPIGYADGMPRALNGAGATVLVAGAHRPIVGRIGMDQFIIDLGDVADSVQLGDPVVLFGDPARDEPAVEVWAELMRTINYEIVSGIGSRVVRVAVDTGAAGEAASEAAGEATREVTQ